MNEEAKNLVVQFQAYQQQLQAVLIQKESLKLQNLEIEKALEELEKTKEKKAFKIAGQIMVLKPVEELKNELKELRENTELRIKSLEKSEERISEKLKNLQKEIKEKVKA
ncbi:MAG: prefoldin subunit beta [Candidatus Aenigmatarchaeota archaeon]